MRSLRDNFLIAMPAMGDPNFNATVTFICKHDSDGALGIVINRPMDMLLKEVFSQLALPQGEEESLAGQQAVLSGGPVQPDRGFVLHRSEIDFESTFNPESEIKVTASQDILASIARGHGPEPAFVALGYAGWGAGQLESELAANAWLSAPADPSIVFDTPYEQRWSAAASLLGVDIHQITNYAGHA
jgi:putative transcriptional regulator